MSGLTGGCSGTVVGAQALPQVLREALRRQRGSGQGHRPRLGRPGRGSVSGPENVGIVFVQTKNDAANAWFVAAGKSLADVQNEINSSSNPGSFAFPEALHISLKVNVESTRATGVRRLSLR